MELPPPPASPVTGPEPVVARAATALTADESPFTVSVVQSGSTSTAVDTALRLHMTVPDETVLDLRDVVVVLPDGLESYRAPWPGREDEASMARLSGSADFAVTIPVAFSADEVVLRVEATGLDGSEWAAETVLSAALLAALPVEQLSLAVNDKPSLSKNAEKQAELLSASGGPK